MPDSYTITVAHPAKCLHPNARAHWAVKAKAKKQARLSARADTCREIVRQNREWLPRWNNATLHVRAYYKTNRRRDKDNIVAWLKSTFDGIADAGIVADDSAFDAPTVADPQVDKENPRIEIVVTKGER